MKTIKNLVLVATVLIGLTGYATEIEIIPSAMVTTMQFTDVKAGQLITIKDDQNTILYSEIIKGNGKYTKRFDLTALKNGDYTFELDKDVEIITKSFSIKSNQVVFQADAVSHIYKPVVKMQGNHLLVSQFAADQKALNVTIYYNGNLIHMDQIAGEPLLKRVYQLSDKQKGDYTVIMNSNGRQFSNTFTI